EEIRWSTGEALASLPQQFMAVAGFPRVAGCNDGSLILIDSPKLNEKAYVHRNGDHSINVIAVCGSDCEFFYVTARWPGSTHHSRVMKRSSLFTQWDENHWRHFPGALLLGDSGYPLLSWLMTPVVQAGANAVGSQSRHINFSDESDGEEDDDVPPETVQGKDVYSLLVRMFAEE
ncbi:hypothetical protein ILUMI_22905, partial [Ignelater luminosus]